jgi:hypothetical protein
MMTMAPTNATYCEAYPGLIAANLPPRWRDGHRRGEWYDEENHLAGQFELEKLTIATLDLAYQDYRDQGDEWVRASFAMHSVRAVRREQATIICSGCNKFKPSLYLVDEKWRCRECHGLCTLLSLLTKDERKILKRDRLRIEVRGGSPLPIRAIPAFERKRIKLMMLEDELQQAGVDALRPHLRERLTLHWPEPDMIQEELEPEERAEIAPRKWRPYKVKPMRADFANFGFKPSG